MNFEKLAEEIGFEKDEYMDLIELFIGSTAGDIDKLKTAIESGDFYNAERAAHSIKGAASSLGLAEISDEARKIENAAKEGADSTPALCPYELEVMLNRIRENYKTCKA